MKRIYALVLAFLCLSGSAAAYNVQAPNSFDDAGRGSWEFKAVRRMCEEKKSPAYGADYFQENRHISRYELAGVIIDLLENGSGLTEADEDALGRMQKSYARELEARGWEEEAEPQKQPIIEIHGDLRLRHTKGEGTDGRARVGFQYDLDDRTSVRAGGKAETDW